MVIYSADSVQPAPTPVPQPAIDVTTNQNQEAPPNPQVVSTPELVVESQDFAVAPQAVVAAPSAELDEQVNTIKSSLYTVMANDTLSGIALRHNTTVHQLRTLNQITGDLILVGQQIRLSAEQQAEVAAQPAPTPPPESAVSQQIHTVQPGEWIYAIARRYAISPDLLVKANNLKNPNMVQPGQQLIIPNQ